MCDLSSQFEPSLPCLVQGRENKVVIFSTVRSNDAGALGFLEDPRRLNVALTRAQHALCVLGNRETLCASYGVWRQWFDHVEASMRSGTAAMGLRPGG